MRHRHAAERRERKAHRHPVVVVGVDRRRRAAARGGDTRSQSAPSSTVAPSLRSSVAIAAMRSVSFTRQLPMPVSVVGPSREQRDDRERHRRVGNRRAVDRRRRASAVPRAPRSSRRRSGRRRPCRASTSANATSPWIESRPTPVDAHRPAADRAGREEVRRRRRVAFDARACPGLDSARRPARETIAQSACSTATPKRSHQVAS